MALREFTQNYIGDLCSCCNFVEKIYTVQDQKIPAVLNDRSPAQAQHYHFKAVMFIASSIHFKITGNLGAERSQQNANPRKHL